MDRDLRVVLSARVFSDQKCFGPGVSQLLKRVDELHSLRAAAMSLSSFTVCMNALRLNRFRMQDTGKDRPLRKQATSMEEIEYEMESLLKSNETEEEKKMTTEVKIKGMMCPHCEAHVKKALEALDGVESAAPDKDAGNAVMTLSKDVSADAIKAAVEDAGYEFLGMTE